MVKLESGTSARFLRGFLLIAWVALASPASASVEWLLQQAKPDGSIATATDLATPSQSTAEAAAAIRALGVSTPLSAADAFVRADEYRGTEELVRLVRIGLARGEPVAALAAELLTHQNADGGFGELPGYDSTPLDTGLALVALYGAGQQRTSQNLAALNYLMSVQTASGGWAIGTNDPSTFVTAHALLGLWQFRQLLPATVTSGARARQFLLDRRQPNGLWESDFASATALIALAPMQLAQGELSSSFAALASHQLANGSWANDVYTTSLAMRAALLSANPDANPDLARVRGRLIDGNSLAALVGASIRLAGASSSQQVSNGQGDFNFGDLAAGNYSLTVEAAGYPALTASLVLRTGQTLDLGTLRLLSTGAPTVARVEGVITNSAGSGIEGATVSVTGATPVVTDSAGRYLVNDVPPGNVVVTASRNGYYAAQGTTTLVAGATVNFSATLRTVQTSGFSITGIFRDAGNQQPLAGVSVTVTGSAQAALTSNSEGAVDATGLAPGEVRIVTSLPGYESRVAIASVNGGQTLDISTSLAAIPVGGPAAFAIEGRVTDAATGSAVQGAVVSVGGAANASTQTDAGGNYRLDGLEPGPFSVVVAASGYQSATATATGTAFLNVEFSPALLLLNTRATGLHGVVVDAETGRVIEGAAVAVSSPGGTANTTSQPNGEFLLRDLTADASLVTITAAGYQPSQLSLTPAEGFVNDVGELAMWPQAFEAPVTLTGRIVNSTTDAALGAVTVIATTLSGTQTTQSAANGSFSVTVPAGQLADLEFVVANFVPARFSLLVTPESADFGQVRLRPEGLDSLLPDLATLSVDSSLVTSNAVTYQVSGSVSARLQNRGYAGAPATTTVIAFEDRNANQSLDEGEPELGRATLGSELLAGETRNLVITVAGSGSFRDVPITVLADATMRVVERDETNNAQISTGACVALPPPASSLTPVLKWRWSGSPARPNDAEVFGPVMVGQFSDDNGDGRIDVRDVPDLVFVTRQQALTVVSGDDGRTLWQTGPNIATGLGSPAIGDIDGDGFNEIVVSNGPRSLLRAFEHTGVQKWQAPNGPAPSDTTRDGITIADLNGDGNPEIITGSRVYSNTGTLLWQGSMDDGGLLSYGTLPIAANIDRTGPMEVIAGRSAYSSTGALLWHQKDAQGDGFNAIGNFDDDPFPEIVLVTTARLYLLEHTGAIKWGPVAIPEAGGRGGAPTVGDFDGDGKPEIGVAGARQYTVFETDGSQKWKFGIQDSSSAFTGSSLFDFDGDGRIELVYADEDFLYILDGASGHELLRIANLSGTTLEYPVVADVDGDGRAEIVVAANAGSQPGVRVFEGGQGEWMPTRPIWNQSTYHIDNVNDDGSIPRVEAEGWLTHNTYRANSAIRRQAEPVADLTAGVLQLLDNGIGQPSSLLVRVGNAGSPLTGGIASVAFYDGAPTAGGRLLGNASIPALATGAYADVRLDGVTTVSPSGTLYAVVDSTHRVTECDEANNSANTLGRPARGALTVSTDRAQYAPGSLVQVQLGIGNTGLFTSNFRAELAVYDAAGNKIADLAGAVANALASGASTSFPQSFDTADLLAGSYELRGSLFDANGQLLAMQVGGFTIAHDPAQGPAASLRVNTDRPRYNTSDLVYIDLLARNLTTASPIAGARVHLVVSGPSSAVVLDQWIELGQLMPGTFRQVQQPLALNGAVEGAYSINGRLEGAGGELLAMRSGSFDVVSNPLVSLTGAITLGATTVESGQTMLCTRAVTNRGTTPISNLGLRYLVVRLGDEALVSEQTLNADIAAGGSNLQVSSIATAGYAAGEYACTVQARIENTWRDLAYGVFKVTTPPISIEATLTTGARGRLLVLLDENDGFPCTPMRDIELWAPFHRSLPADASIRVDLFNDKDQLIDTETAQLSQYQGTVNRNRGSTANLRITGASRDVLTIDLSASSSLGAGYRVIATATSPSIAPIVVESNAMGEADGWRAGFGARFGDFQVSGGTPRGGGHMPAPTPTVPSLDSQRVFLEALLNEAGWSYTIVTDDEAFERELRTGGYSQYALFAEHEKLDEVVQKELREAVFRGEGLLDAGQHDHRHHSFDEALGLRPDGRESHARNVSFEASWLPAVTATIGRTSEPLRIRLQGATPVARFERSYGYDSVAATQYQFGLGKSVYVGYDLLAEAAAAGAASHHATLLKNALLQVQPAAVSTRTGAVIPLVLTVHNRGQATPAVATLPIPAGVEIVDAGTAELGANSLGWTFTLAADQTREFIVYVRLPDSAGAVSFDARVQSGVAPNLLDQAHAPLSVNVLARATLAEARALAASNSRCSQVRQWLDHAANWLDRGNEYFALTSLLRAADEAMDLSDFAQATQLRLMIDDVIADVEKTIP